MVKQEKKDFKDMTIEEREAYRNIRFLKLRELNRIKDWFIRSVDAIIKELEDSYLLDKKNNETD